MINWYDFSISGPAESGDGPRRRSQVVKIILCQRVQYDHMPVDFIGEGGRDPGVELFLDENGPDVLALGQLYQSGEPLGPGSFPSYSTASCSSPYALAK